jgi:Tol biopolymer transport system component
VIQDGKQNLRVYDPNRKTWTRLTFEVAPDLLPPWTPDGEFLAFQSAAGCRNRLECQRVTPPGAILGVGV